MHIHYKEEEDSGFTCRECSYQTSNRDQLIELIEIIHTQNTQSSFKCEMYKISFRSQREINVHDVNKHKNYLRPYHKFSMNNKCEYDSECHFHHSKLKTRDHICYKCGDIFSNKTLLFKYIKVNMASNLFGSLQKTSVPLVINATSNILRKLHIVYQ